jgi:very-short-patch-repair endonuclease
MEGAKRPKQRGTRRPKSPQRHVDCEGQSQRDSRPGSLDECHVKHVDRVLAELAAAQLGNVTHRQVRDAGLGNGAIQYWVSRGRLHPRFRGVYALGHVALPADSLQMAAVLACGPRAIVSHATAAHLWGLRPGTREPLEVTVVGRNVRHRPGIRVHRTEVLLKRDVRHRHNIPLTSPARTLLDIAPTLEDRELERVLHEAMALKLTTLSRLRATLNDYPRRRGSARLVELARQSPSSRTRSGGEEEMLRLLRRSRIHQPLVNAQVGEWNVDFYWPEHRLVVEVDGIDFHSSRVNIERDHRKDLEMRKLGIDVMRFVGRQVRREPEMLLVTIARELALRESS